MGIKHSHHEHKKALGKMAMKFQFVSSNNTRIDPLNTPFDQVPKAELKRILAWTEHNKEYRLDALAALAVWGCALHWQHLNAPDDCHPGTHRVIQSDYSQWDTNRSGTLPKFKLFKVDSGGSPVPFDMVLQIIWARTEFTFRVKVVPANWICSHCNRDRWVGQQTDKNSPL